MAKYMKGGAMNVYSWIAILVLVVTGIVTIVLWAKGMFDKKQAPSASKPLIGPSGVQKHKLG
jgi:hypothetical protein